MPDVLLKEEEESHLASLDHVQIVLSDHMNGQYTVPPHNIVAIVADQYTVPPAALSPLSP